MMLMVMMMVIIMNPSRTGLSGDQGNSKYFSKLLKMEYIFFGDEGNSKYFSKSTLFSQ